MPPWPARALGGGGSEYSGPLAGTGRLYNSPYATRGRSRGSTLRTGRVLTLCRAGCAPCACITSKPSSALGLMAIRPGVCTREGLGRFPGCGYDACGGVGALRETCGSPGNCSGERPSLVGSRHYLRLITSHGYRLSALTDNDNHTRPGPLTIQPPSGYE